MKRSYDFKLHRTIISRSSLKIGINAVLYINIYIFRDMGCEMVLEQCVYDEYNHRIYL